MNNIVNFSPKRKGFYSPSGHHPPSLSATITPLRTELSAKVDQLWRLLQKVHSQCMLDPSIENQLHRKRIAALWSQAFLEGEAAHV